MLSALPFQAGQVSVWTGPAIWALALGITGTLLGLANLAWLIIQYVWRTRTTLTIQPQFARPYGGLEIITTTELHQDAYLLVTVVNESHFAVTLNKLEVLLADPEKRLSPIIDEVRPNGPWPRRLERKDAVTVVLRRITYKTMLELGAKSIRVTTADGGSADGVCPAMESLYARHLSLTTSTSDEADNHRG